MAIPIQNEIIRGSLAKDEHGKTMIIGKSMSRDGKIVAYLNTGFDKDKKKYIPVKAENVAKELTQSYERSLNMQASKLFDKDSNKASELKKKIPQMLKDFASGFKKGDSVTVELDGNVKGFYNEDKKSHIINAKLDNIKLDSGFVKKTVKLISDSISKHNIPLSTEAYIITNGHAKPITLNDCMNGKLEAKNMYVKSSLNNIATVDDMKNMFLPEENFLKYKMSQDPNLSFNKKDKDGNLVYDNTSMQPILNLYTEKKKALLTFGGTYQMVKSIFEKFNNPNSIIPIKYEDGTVKKVSLSNIKDFEKDKKAISQIYKLFLQQSGGSFEKIARWLGETDEKKLNDCKEVDFFTNAVDSVKNSKSFDEYKENLEKLFKAIKDNGELSNSSVKLSSKLKVSTVNAKDLNNFEIIQKIRNGNNLSEEDKKTYDYLSSQNKVDYIFNRVQSQIKKDNAFINTYYKNIAAKITKNFEAISKSALNGGINNSSYSDVVKGNLEKVIDYKRDENGKIKITNYKPHENGKTALDTPLGNVAGFYTINNNKFGSEGFVNSSYSLNSNNELKKIVTRTPEQLLQSLGFPYYQATKTSNKAVGINLDQIGALPNFSIPSTISIDKSNDVEIIPEEEIVEQPTAINMENVPTIKDEDIGIDMDMIDDLYDEVEENKPQVNNTRSVPAP